MGARPDEKENPSRPAAQHRVPLGSLPIGSGAECIPADSCR